MAYDAFFLQESDENEKRRSGGSLPPSFLQGASIQDSATLPLIGGRSENVSHLAGLQVYEQKQMKPGNGFPPDVGNTAYLLPADQRHQTTIWQTPHTRLPVDRRSLSEKSREWVRACLEPGNAPQEYPAKGVSQSHQGRHGSSPHFVV